MDQTYLKAICILKISLLWTRHKLKTKQKKKGKAKLYGLFLWMGFNFLKARATSRRQVTFYH